MAEDLKKSLQEQCTSEKKEVKDQWKQKMLNSKSDQKEKLTKDYE